MLRSLVFVGIAVQGAMFLGVPLFHTITGELPGPLKDEPDPLKKWIHGQIFSNSELTQQMLYSFWVLQWLCMFALTAAPRIYRALPCLWMLFYYAVVAGTEEKRLSEAAVPGHFYPVDNWVIHGIFALVWVGIFALPEPGSGKAKTL